MTVVRTKPGYLRPRELMRDWTSSDPIYGTTVPEGTIIHARLCHPLERRMVAIETDGGRELGRISLAQLNTCSEPIDARGTPTAVPRAPVGASKPTPPPEPAAPAERSSSALSVALETFTEEGYAYSGALFFKERERFFYWARDRAYDAMLVARQAEKLDIPGLRAQERAKAMRYLELARDLFPLRPDDDPITIEQILHGRVP